MIDSPALRLDLWQAAGHGGDLAANLTGIGRVTRAAANRIGRDAANTYLGQSRIVGPLGECLAAPDATERLITATLDLSARNAARAAFDYLADLDSLAAGKQSGFETD